MKSEAFYLSSDLKYTILFEFLFDIPNFYEREGFEQLMKDFTNHIASFGKENLFPEEIINMLNDEELDRLLQDTELIPNMTFFLKLNSDETFYSRETCEPYRLRGVNGHMSMVETLNGKVINILEMKNLKRVFERVGR
ncbi:MAG: hypothetical protein B7X89_11000 [Sulfuricurvum sp. 17-40-25]|nr:MAG: hypothetical protein B7Y30_11085 [Campylobacterales bacterium 16-40-21]OZA02042.1 MAG: hypothetical protein B7X89_11000 [Sulfuricurvum sp. 17-40-25]